MVAQAGITPIALVADPGRDRRRGPGHARKMDSYHAAQARDSYRAPDWRHGYAGIARLACDPPMAARNE